MRGGGCLGKRLLPSQFVVEKIVTYVTRNSESKELARKPYNWLIVCVNPVKLANPSQLFLFEVSLLILLLVKLLLFKVNSLNAEGETNGTPGRYFLLFHLE